MARILVYGDSIAWGAGDRRGGRCDRLKQDFLRREEENSSFDYSVYNLGVSADSVQDVITRFESEIKARKFKDQQIILVFAVGVNDTMNISKDDDYTGALDRFAQEIKKLVDLAKEFTDKIVFVGLNPVDEWLTKPVSWDRHVSYDDTVVRAFDRKLEDVCAGQSVGYIGIYNSFKDKDYKYMLSDGVHPNNLGHELIYDKVRDFLLKRVIG